MKGIILTSHGLLADGMLDTISIFTGEPEQIKSLCLMPGDDIFEFTNKLKDAVDEVDTGDGVMIFCDLLFGSPCNCSGKLLGDSNYCKLIDIITGMNLSMVMEYVTSRENNIQVEDAIVAGKEGIQDFVDMFTRMRG